jgi:hypothetical protein
LRKELLVSSSQPFDWLKAQILGEPEEEETQKTEAASESAALPAEEGDEEEALSGPEDAEGSIASENAADASANDADAESAGNDNVDEPEDKEEAAGS